MRAWAADREALRAAYAGVAREPVPARLAETVWARGDGAPVAVPSPAANAPARGKTRGAQPRWASVLGWRTSGVAAAAAALFVLGAVVGALLAWQWAQQQLRHPGTPARALASAGAAAAPQGWLQRAAFAHSVYTPEPRHPVEVKAQEEHLARWLTRRIDAPVKLFDLRSLGFELIGGRLLPDGPGKSAQLMYQDGAGKRVTVYLRKPEPGTDAAFRYEQQGALGMFYWVEDKCGFALVGELPKERLLAMAKSIYEQDATLPAPSMTPPAAAASAAPSPAASTMPPPSAASMPSK
ncbi:MAG: anti-sigma factor [Rubrivivax sp.]